MTNQAEPGTIWVIAIRDPDYANEFESFPREVDVKFIDIDLGSGDLDDPEEASDWCLAHLTELSRYPAKVAERVAWQVRGIIQRAELDVNEMLATLASDYQTVLTDEQISILRNTRQSLA